MSANEMCNHSYVRINYSPNYRTRHSGAGACYTFTVHDVLCHITEIIFSHTPRIYGSPGMYVK